MVVSAGVMYVLNVFSILVTLALTGYYVVAIMSTDLMNNLFFVWVTLLVLGVLSLIEAIYFILALAFYIMTNRSLSLLLCNIVRLYDSPAQIVGNIAFMAEAVLYNLSGGSDDGTFQIIAILLAGGVKLFLTAATLAFNYNWGSYGAVEEEETEHQRGPYTFTRVKTVEEEEAPKPVQQIQPIYLVANPRMIYAMNN